MTLIQVIERNETIQKRIEIVSNISDHCKNIRNGQNGFQRKSRIVEALQNQMMSNVQKAIIE